MSKRGSTTLRTALYQAASLARLHEPRLGEIYNHHKQQMNKHHGVAISHVARKLIGIIMLSVPAADLTILQKYALMQLDSL
jgi:transposase